MAFGNPSRSGLTETTLLASTLYVPHNPAPTLPSRLRTQAYDSWSCKKSAFRPLFSQASRNSIGSHPWLTLVWLSPDFMLVNNDGVILVTAQPVNLHNGWCDPMIYMPCIPFLVGYVLLSTLHTHRVRTGLLHLSSEKSHHLLSLSNIPCKDSPTYLPP